MKISNKKSYDKSIHSNYYPSERRFYCYNNNDIIDIFDKSLGFYKKWKVHFNVKTYESGKIQLNLKQKYFIDEDLSQLEKDWLLVFRQKERLIDFAEKHIINLNMYEFGSLNYTKSEQDLHDKVINTFSKHDFYIKEEATAHLQHTSTKVRYDFLVRPRPESKIGIALKSIGLINLTFAIECKSFANEHLKQSSYLKKERQLINQCLSYRHSVYLDKNNKKKSVDFVLIYTGDLDNPKIGYGEYCNTPAPVKVQDYYKDEVTIKKCRDVRKAINTTRQVYPFLQEQNIFELQIFQNEINILTPYNELNWPSTERANGMIRTAKVGETYKYSIDSVCLLSYNLKTKKLQIAEHFNKFLGLNAGSSNRKVKSQQIVI